MRRQLDRIWKVTCAGGKFDCSNWPEGDCWEDRLHGVVNPNSRFILMNAFVESDKLQIYGELCLRWSRVSQGFKGASQHSMVKMGEVLWSPVWRKDSTEAEIEIYHTINCSTASYISDFAHDQERWKTCKRNGIKMLRRTSILRRLDHITNAIVRKVMGVMATKDKFDEKRSSWFGYLIGRNECHTVHQTI